MRRCPDLSIELWFTVIWMRRFLLYPYYPMAVVDLTKSSVTRETTGPDY